MASNPFAGMSPIQIEQAAGAPVYNPGAPLGPALSYFGANPDQLLTPAGQQALQQNAVTMYPAPTIAQNFGANVVAAGSAVVKPVASAVGAGLAGIGGALSTAALGGSTGSWFGLALLLLVGGGAVVLVTKG